MNANGFAPLALGLLLLVGSALGSTRVAFDRPATNWNEALPLGNGRLGAMVYGGVERERVRLNEDTLYSGWPGSRDIPLDVRADLPRLIEWSEAGRYADVEAFVTKNWLGAVPAVYQPLGELTMDFEHAGEPTDYRRELDLKRAICRVEYAVDGARFTREIFASHPDELIVARFSADRRNALRFDIRLSSSHPVETRIDAEGALGMSGRMPDFVAKRKLETIEARNETWKYPRLWNADGSREPELASRVYRGEDGRAMRFHAELKVLHEGGSLKKTAEGLRVENANEVVLLFAAASSYNGFDQPPSGDAVDEKTLARNRTRVSDAFETLKARHVRDHAELFDRVDLRLSGSDESRGNPAERDSAEWAERMFHFGRYLMIAGSREGTQPLNLQGVWNHHPIPPWASAYTLNINLQMNYWPAHACGLSACAEPLTRLIRELAENGREVAREMYGLDGWVAHHNTTIWRGAQPVDHKAHTTYWPLAGAWLAAHLHAGFEYDGDLGVLERETYPLMKGACEFLLGWMTRDAQGRWITPLGTSPENRFEYVDATGITRAGSVAPAPTMDLVLIRELFTNTIAAAERLNMDAAFATRLRERLDGMKGYAIGSDGALMEWSRPFADFEPAHRHYSHLYGLFPGDDISLDRTPELADAARKALEKRVAGALADPESDDTGWSQAWKATFWARLREGDRAEKVLDDVFRRYTLPNQLASIYPRKKVALGYPAFQIDANLGVTTAVMETLMRSSDGEIELLPALPARWSNGAFRGWRAKGGFVVDLRWADGELIEARVRATRAGEVRLLYRGRSRVLPCAEGRDHTLGRADFK